MTDAINTDVLVVGLGPAGASAARAAAARGLRVIAIDRKAVAGVPVQCAEFVPTALGQEVNLQSAERQPIDAMRTVVEADTADETDFRGRMIDRERFDAALVASAEAAGADCRFRLGLATLTADGIAALTDGTTLAARLIIGADGPRSRVGRAIGQVNRELVDTRQITVPLLASEHATDIYLSAGIPGGYAWLFPKGAVANLGLGVLPSYRRLLKPRLETLRLQLMADSRIGNSLLGMTGGAIPVGGMLRAAATLGTRTVLLAGDAAGLTNPITGAGIPAAVMSGRMAGEAAASWISGRHDAALDYAADLEDLFGASIARARRRRLELLEQYGGDTTPGAAALRRSWVAYPQYWAA